MRASATAHRAASASAGPPAGPSAGCCRKPGRTRRP
jgi:hypothetical protein